MRFKRGFYLLIFFSNSSFLYSQELYMPRDVRVSYENETRQYNGLPGTNYWQNYTDYDIRVKFNPKTLLVDGKAVIWYHNNSPDNIDHLVLRLYQNHFKKGNARNRSIDPSDVTDGMKITLVKSRTDSISLINYTSTNMYVYLKDELLSGDSMQLAIHWNFKLPSIENQRFGAYNGGNFISLWYPQIAVYDDVHGWDSYEFDWEQEFYNDFNNFYVEINVPRNYLVHATGKLLNPEKTLHPSILNKYLTARDTNSIVHVVAKPDLNSGLMTTKGKSIKWQYEARSVPDFAFAVSNQYLWDATMLKVQTENGGRDVFVSAVYHPDSKDFREVARLASKSIHYFSEKMPSVPYPYEAMTIFNGEKGGMEFPMMVNNSSSTKRFFTVLLVSHEIAHAYFPFYMGINERKYSWMDEGWAEFLPVNWQHEEHPEYHYLKEMISTYVTYAGKEDEVIPMVPAIFYNQNAIESYRIMSYYRAGVAYYVLRNILGDELFKSTLQKFMEAWNGKHPLPYDFFNCFNHFSGMDLNWFWKSWFFEPGYPDLALKKVSLTNKMLSMEIEKTGKLPVPLIIKIIYHDDTTETLEFNAGIWKNTSEFSQSFQTDREVKLVTITNNLVPDVDITNNTYHFTP